MNEIIIGIVLSIAIIIFFWRLTVELEYVQLAIKELGKNQVILSKKINLLGEKLKVLEPIVNELNIMRQQ